MAARKKSTRRATVDTIVPLRAELQGVYAQLREREGSLLEHRSRIGQLEDELAKIGTIRDERVNLVSTIEALRERCAVLQREKDQRWRDEKNQSTRESELRNLVKKALDIVTYIRMDMVLRGGDGRVDFDRVTDGLPRGGRTMGIAELQTALEQAMRT